MRWEWAPLRPFDDTLYVPQRPRVARAKPPKAAIRVESLTLPYAQPVTPSQLAAAVIRHSIAGAFAIAWVSGWLFVGAPQTWQSCASIVVLTLPGAVWIIAIVYNARCYFSRLVSAITVMLVSLLLLAVYGLLLVAHLAAANV